MFARLFSSLMLVGCLLVSGPTLALTPAVPNGISNQLGSALTTVSLKKKKKKKKKCDSGEKRSKKGKCVCKKGYKKRTLLKGCKKTLKKAVKDTTKAVKKTAKKVKKGVKKTAKKAGKAAKKVAKKVGKAVVEVVKSKWQSMKAIVQLAKCIKQAGGRNADSRFQRMKDDPSASVTAAVGDLSVESADMEGITSSNALTKVWARMKKQVKNKAKKKKSMAVLYCVLKIVEPRVQKVLKGGQKVLKKLESKLTKTFKNKIMPRLMATFVKLMKADLESRKDLNQVLALAREVAGQVLLTKQRMNGISNAVKKYQSALESKNAAKAKAAYKDLQKVFKNSSKLRSTIIIGTFKRVVRKKAYRLIDEKVAPVVEKAIKGLSTGLAMAEGIVDGTCGLVPFVGAAICTVVTRGFRVLWDYVLEEKLRNLAIRAMKKQVKHLTNLAGGLMQKHLGDKVDAKMDLAEKKLGKASAGFKQVMKVMAKHIINDEMKAMLDANATYEASLLSLLKTVPAAP
jgi:hypothetical protein